LENARGNGIHFIEGVDEMDKIKILLVDDEEEFVKTLSERIKMRNLSPEIALNGEEALQLVEDEVPDVMVLDLKMQGRLYLPLPE